MIDEMSEYERKRLHANGKEIYRLLKALDGVIPRGHAYVGELIATLLAEVERGYDTPLLREMGYLLLHLVFPIVAENFADVHDQIERLFSMVDGGDLDDIPY